MSPACASGTVAVGTAMELIRSGRCDVVLVCGVDALSKMVAYGFHSLKALSCGVCHPLGQGRDGINIGEGCGVLVLESREHALQRKAGIYAQCVSCAMGTRRFISPVLARMAGDFLIRCIRRCRGRPFPRMSWIILTFMERERG